MKYLAFCDGEISFFSESKPFTLFFGGTIRTIVPRYSIHPEFCAYDQFDIGYPDIYITLARSVEIFFPESIIYINRCYYGCKVSKTIFFTRVRFVKY